jgi:NADH:ubiquinone oxidoreductase subunit E
MDQTATDRIIDGYDGDASNLVMILQDIQEVHNYLPEPTLKHVATTLSLPLSQVYNVATFYSSFSLVERGRHVIRVCDGTACHLRGANNLRDEICRQLSIEDGETTDDRMFTLESVACLGACALAPVMAVGGKYHGKMTPDKVAQTLDDYRSMAIANPDA